MAGSYKINKSCRNKTVTIYCFDLYVIVTDYLYGLPPPNFEPHI